jgi:hypothetical protein
MQVDILRRLDNSEKWANFQDIQASWALDSDGQTIAAGGTAYRCIVPGVSTSAPTGTGTDVNDGGATIFSWSSAIDYTSLDAFAAANPVLTQPAIVQFRNDQPGAAYPLRSSNVISSASAPLTITAAPGESFRDGVDQPLGAPNAIQAEDLLTSNRPSSARQTIVTNNDLAAAHHDANAPEVDKLSTAGTVTYNIRNALPWVSGALYTDGQTVATGGNHTGASFRASARARRLGPALTSTTAAPPFLTGRRLSTILRSMRSRQLIPS